MKSVRNRKALAHGAKKVKGNTVQYGVQVVERRGGGKAEGRRGRGQEGRGAEGQRGEGPARCLDLAGEELHSKQRLRLLCRKGMEERRDGEGGASIPHVSLLWSRTTEVVMK